MAQKNVPIDWQALRAIPVEGLVRARYGDPDQAKSTRTTWQWDTEQGRLLVNQSEQYWKFMDTGMKGKGPIDWLVKVEGMSVLEAAERLSNGAFIDALPKPRPKAVASQPEKPYETIADNPERWPHVRDYLIQVRKLPAHLVDEWHENDRVRGISPSTATTVPYASFPLLSPEGKEVGSVLRCAGTPEQQRQQIAHGFYPKRNQKGSQPTQGFWQSHESPQAKSLLLVEAPLDAMALYAALLEADRDPRDFVIRASAGEALNAVHWEGNWDHIRTAFDRDTKGEEFAQMVAKAHPGGDVQRLTPPMGSKDWSEAWVKHVALTSQAAKQPEYEPGDD